LSSQKVIEFVRQGIALQQPLRQICENMIDNCVANSPVTDNMTVIIVGLLQGKTQEEWYDMIATRVWDDMIATRVEGRD